MNLRGCPVRKSGYEVAGCDSNDFDLIAFRPVCHSVVVRSNQDPISGDCAFYLNDPNDLDHENKAGAAGMHLNDVDAVPGTSDSGGCLSFDFQFLETTSILFEDAAHNYWLLKAPPGSDNALDWHTAGWAFNNETGQSTSSSNTVTFHAMAQDEHAQKWMTATLTGTLGTTATCGLDFSNFFFTLAGSGAVQ